MDAHDNYPHSDQEARNPSYDIGQTNTGAKPKDRREGNYYIS